jgi:hypothetical protein
MNWEIKYSCSFYDILLVKWTVDILEYLASPPASVLEMKAGSDPLIFDFLSDTDDILDSPIRGSKFSINVVSKTSFQWTGIYTNQDRSLKVNIYYGSTPYLTGFITSNNYSEPYNDTPYEITISANDGLGYLKEILYDDSGTPYTGRILESQIILDILLKIGITTFTEYVNIYETRMNKGTSDSPMDQTKIDAGVFKGLYCYDVLCAILEKYKALIRQVPGGTYVIYRPKELTQATVHGRAFTAATTKSHVTITPQKFINRITTTPSHITDLRDVNGGIMMKQTPAKKITVNQDYGNKESWIENWDFKNNTFTKISSIEYTLNSWTKSNNYLIQPITNVPINESDGVVIVTHGTSFSSYLWQNFGVYSLNTSNIFKIDFEYLFYNTGVEKKGVHFYISISAGGKYLHGGSDIAYDPEYCVWLSSVSYIDIKADSPKGSTGWVSFNRKIVGIPITGTYTINIYGLTTSIIDVFPAVKNIRFYSTSDELIIKKVFRGWNFPYEIFPIGWLNKSKRYRKIYNDNTEIVQKQYIVLNAIAGREVEYNFVLGDVSDSNIDNVIEQFNGSLGCLAAIPAVARIDMIILDPFSTTGDADITCEGITETAVWYIDDTTTAENFCNGYYSNYFAVGVIISHTGGTIYFTAVTAGTDFTVNDTAFVNTSGDFAATFVGTYQYNQVAGSGLTYSKYWQTRDPGTETNKGLLELIGDELAYQFSRQKQMLTSYPIQETKNINSDPHIDLLGCYEDSTNQLGGNNRKFVFNRGNYGIKNRKFVMDIIEIIL